MMQVNKIICKLSKVQNYVMLEMEYGAVIGELSDKRNGRYELFIRKRNWFPETCHPCEHPFILKTLNKNTVFVLLELGLIHKDNKVAESMLPFSRDYWYVFEGKDAS